jgi:hypothetical protein
MFGTGKSVQDSEKVMSKWQMQRKTKRSEGKRQKKHEEKRRRKGKKIEVKNERSSSRSENTVDI